MTVTPVEIKPLLFRAMPYRDESFLGYLLRLSDLNEYETPTWLLPLADMRKDMKNNNFSSYSLNTHLGLEGLSALTGIGAERLRSLEYRPIGAVEGRLTGNYDVLGNSLPLYLIRLHNPKFCPFCLRDQPYVRKLWELTVITACPIHGCLLFEKCPSCGKRPTYMRRRLWECKCGADWRKFEPVLLPPNELVVVQNFYRLCGLPFRSALTNFDGVDNKLLELDLRSFVRVLVFISSQFNGRIDTLGKFLATNLDNVQVHELLIKGFHVFDGFPSCFYRFLDWRRENPSRSDKPSIIKIKGWTKYFYGYKAALFTQLAGSEFDFLRDAFNEYIRQFNYETALSQTTEVSDGAAGLKSIRAKIGDQPEAVMSCKQAGQALRVTSRTIEKFIASGVIEAAVGCRKHAGHRVFLINRASVERLKARLHSTLSLKPASARLGLSPAQGKELIIGGVLNPVRGRSVDNYRHAWLIAESDIQCLIDELISSTSPQQAQKSDVSGAWEKTIYNFTITMSFLRQSGFGLCELVELIKSRRIRTYRKGVGFSFSDLGFEAVDVWNFIAPEFEETYSVKQTKKLLGISQGKVSACIKAGILKAAHLPKLKTAGLRIHKDDLQTFRETYITSDELKQLANVTFDDIESYLDSRGIKPVWLYHQTECLCVLPRSIFAGRNISQELHREAMAVRGILSPEEAARDIGITGDELEVLVADGLLKPYAYRTNSRADATKRELLFSKHSVEKFKYRRDKIHGLISTAVAARLLGYRTGNNFLLNEVKRGHIKPIKKMDWKRNNLFFDRAEVETLSVERARQKAMCKDSAYVDTKGAAAVLGVNVSAVHKMIADGIVQPEQGRDNGHLINLYRRSDIERLKLERDVYKADCVRRGKTIRYGRSLRAA